MENSLFIRACRREPVERTPIWVMRQAGRYLPEYRAVRAKADFHMMCKTPELATEVTLQPIDLIGTDAAIIFSDILVIPEAMGMPFEMVEKRGPVFHDPIRHENDMSKLKKIDPTVDLKYVLDAVSMTKRELAGRVPLIGFCGAPWTLLTYMVEGSGSKNYTHVKKMIYGNPQLADAILTKLADACGEYLCAKIDAGADAVQIFDTWAGILPQKDFLNFSLKYIKQIVEKVKHKNKPIIIFAKGVHHNHEAIAACGADVMGLDWTMDIASVRKNIGDKVALQGNLDPNILYTDDNIIAERAEAVMSAYGNGSGHIFNLGHGMMPDMEPGKLKFLVDYVKSESPKYHQ